jgi:hypothetical protein
VAALALVLVIGEMDEAGAAVIGWPLVWGAAQLPFRALGVAPTPDVAFGFGLALSLAFLAVTTVATGILALELTGRRSAGVLAAGLFALWPFVPAAVVGEGAWRNGSWTVDVGLALYTEPLSTMLVAVALVLVLRPRASGDTLVAAGLLVGLATAVKLSNGVIAALLLGALALRRPTGLGRDTLPFLAGALVSAPIVIAYWPKGYVGLFGGSIAPIPDPWGLDRVASAWTDSHVFRPVLLALLVPLVALGSWLVRDAYRLAVTLGPVLVTAGLYSAYAYTPEHPRFLYVALPPALALAAAGAVGLAAAASALVGREPEAASSRMPSPTTRGADGRRG